MNISRDPNKLTPILNFDTKTSLLDGIKSPESPSVSFGELLKREADSFVNKFESPKAAEAPAQVVEPIIKEANSNPSDKKEEVTTTSSTEKKEKIEEKPKQIEDEEIGIQELEEGELELEVNELGFFANILSFQPNDTNQNQIRKNEDLPAEKSSPQLALLKNNEKQTPYLHSSKETTSFIEDAKKLAESIFKKDRKEIKGKDLPISNESKDFIEKTSTSKETIDAKLFLQKGNVTFANFDRSKLGNKNSEKTNVGSSLPSSVSAMAKEVVKKETESTPISFLKDKDTQLTLSKENHNTKEPVTKKKISSFLNENTDEKKPSDLQGLNERMTRSLGVKDKEFTKSDTKTNSIIEKVKSKEQADSMSTVNIGSVQSKEESGSHLENGNKNSSSGRDGFSFSNELKMQSRAEELTKTEKSGLPTKQEMQKNMDELVKQARFDIVQNGKSTAEIIMNPKEFGRLTLRVSVDGEKVEGRILVETEEMKELLTGEIAKLRENLKDSGLSLESLLVDVWENTDSNFSNKSFEDRKNAEEMIRSSSNRNVSTQTDDETSAEISLPSTRYNAVEIFA